MTSRTLLVVFASAAGAAAVLAQSAPPVQTLGVPGRANATPSLAADGRTVAAVWTAIGPEGTDVYVTTSADAGATFAAPRRVNDQPGDASANSEQPPRVAFSGAGASRVVTVLWSKRNEGPLRSRRDVMRVARSTDGGRTFAASRTTHDPAASGARGWMSLAPGPGGLVHAVWLDGRDADRKIADAKAHGAEHKGQPPQDVYYGTFGPDGRSSETLVATGVCFCCKTAVTVDARGTVYAAWRHIYPGSMRDIAFVKSVEGGGRFDPPVRVSEDNWQLNGCPEDGPALAVDSRGAAHLAWATVVGGETPEKALFYAVSHDGRTFTPRVRIPSAAGATPGRPQLVLNPDGGAAVVWDELVAGVPRVVMSVATPARVFGAPRILSGDEAASRPVIVRAGDGALVVAWTSRSAGDGAGAAESAIRLRRVTPR